jgi:hypothetical protein
VTGAAGQEGKPTLSYSNCEGTAAGREKKKGRGEAAGKGESETEKTSEIDPVDSL